MKQLLTLILLLTLSTCAFSQDSEIKSKIQGINLKAIQKGKLANYDMESQFKNKVVIIEFWETWCGPCIEGMHHLKLLKEKFSDNLKIICISSDDFNKACVFIDKNKFPFDFIFDKEKIMQERFPHTGIPYTIVIDKKGKIQALTHPGYLDYSNINQLLLGNNIDVPNIKGTEFPNTENENIETPLISFKLFNYQLGETRKSSLSTINNKKRIVTGYTANAFIDTVETISEYNVSHINIIELYQLAYKNIPEMRFLYDNDLKYIKSVNPNNIYNLNYKISNLFGDFNTTLVRQLDASLGLETSKVVIDTNVLVLKKVEINGNTIKTADVNSGKWLNTNITSDNLFEVTGNQVDATTVANLISQKTKLFVESDIKGEMGYELKVVMDKPNLNINEWIDYFQKEGLYLTKERRRIEIIKIKRAQ